MFLHRIQALKDFSDIPGARYIKNGDYSAELFRETILIPKLMEAIDKNEILEVNLDGTCGCCDSFLEETFGGLVRRGTIGILDILKYLVITSKENRYYSKRSYTFIVEQMHRQLNHKRKY